MRVQLRRISWGALTSPEVAAGCSAYVARSLGAWLYAGARILRPLYLAAKRKGCAHIGARLGPTLLQRC